MQFGVSFILILASSSSIRPIHTQQSTIIDNVPFIFWDARVGPWISSLTSLNCTLCWLSFHRNGRIHSRRTYQSENFERGFGRLQDMVDAIVEATTMPVAATGKASSNMIDCYC